ncbi:MAG: carbon storage regulator [Planctomycetaceae bacterium]
MLVLSRRKNETIHIGNGISVTILGFRRGGAVKLGIEAPESVLIHRAEVVAESDELIAYHGDKDQDAA